MICIFPFSIRLSSAQEEEHPLAIRFYVIDPCLQALINLS